MRYQFVVLSIIVFLFVSCHYHFLNAGSRQELRGKSFLQPRSVGTNGARDMAGWRTYFETYDKYDKKGFHSAFACTPGYARTYRAGRIAEYFFGSDNILVSGSQVTGRDINHVLADYFGLSPTFFSTVFFKPILTNGILDFAFYGAYSSFYFRVHAPLNWAHSIIELNETVSNDGSTTPFPAFYMDTPSIPAPAHSFTEAIHGNIRFGHLKEGLHSSIISPCVQREFHVADVHITGGWHFLERDTSHCGLSLLLVVPTGNRPTGQFLFEPVVGNGHHWEVGAGFDSHVVIWEYEADRSIALYTNLLFTHLFAARQRRSFDVCAGCCQRSASAIYDNFASRYILAKEFDNTGNYTGTLAALANKTTLACKVKAGLQMDFVFMAGYTGPRFSWDVGYNGWLRTKESIEITEQIEEKKWGLKGIQNVANGGGLINTTQSQATINGNNLGDSNPGLFVNQALFADATSPIFLTNNDIDRKSAANPRAFTHKFFAHLGYHHHQEWWHRIDQWFTGVGAEIEFESAHRRSLSKPNKNSISQWSFWVKTGVSF